MTDKYQELCAEARKKLGLEPDVYENVVCKDCFAKHVCEV